MANLLQPVDTNSLAPVSSPDCKKLLVCADGDGMPVRAPARETLWVVTRIRTRKARRSYTRTSSAELGATLGLRLLARTHSLSLQMLARTHSLSLSPISAKPSPGTISRFIGNSLLLVLIDRSSHIINKHWLPSFSIGSPS